MAATPPSANRSERSGRWLARVWKAFVRQEIRLARWMVAHGIPPSLVTAFLWLAKLAFIIIVGYALFWLAVILVIAFVVARGIANTELSTKADEKTWRYGFHGFGLYDSAGHRVDPYDPTENP